MSATLTTKQQFWFDHLQQADASGNTLAQYAQDTDLDVSQLYSWRKQLRSSGFLPAFSARNNSAPHFARVVTHANVTSPAPATLQLSIGRTTLSFSQLPDVAWLATVISTLESRP